MITGGKTKGSSSAGGSQSWRELAGRRKKHLNSPQARRRRQQRILRLGLFFLAVLSLFGGGFWLLSMLGNRDEAIQINTPSRLVERIVFDTDGVLPDRWLGSVIELKKGSTMMDVDIHAIKVDLEKEEQVLSASVERVFPSTLKISVQERVPVLRIAVEGPGGRPVERLVATDGTIYRGVGYPKPTLSNLPFLEPYRHSDGRIKPLRGIERVAELLAEARGRQPNLARTWKIVSLKGFSGDPSLIGQVIAIRSTRVPEIVFGAGSDFGQQLDRLGLILEYVRARGNPSLKRIDLSLRGSAAVQFTSGRISSF